MPIEPRHKFVFIINRKAGRKPRRMRQIMKLVADEDLPYIITEYPGHAYEAAQEAIQKQHIPVAVGGDGTVHEVAASVAETGGAFGIIPAGSGNGIARHLRISMKPKKAFANLLEGVPQPADSGKANNQFFLMLAGTGFDADVAEEMTKVKSRGLRGYLQVILKLIKKRSPIEVRTVINGKEYTEKALMVVAANSSQFGNNLYIAPNASMKDGLLNFVLVKPVRNLEGILLILRLFFGKPYRSKHVIQQLTPEFTLHTQKETFNIDGEAIKIKSPVNIKIIPDSVKIISSVPIK